MTTQTLPIPPAQGHDPAVPLEERCTCHTRIGCWAHGPQPREHAVPCGKCLQPTWAHNAICDTCAGVPRPTWTPISQPTEPCRRDQHTVVCGYCMWCEHSAAALVALQGPEVQL